MAQFRSGILPLKIETGRYTNIPWQFRICELCDMDDVEDEFHFMMCCTRYNNERSSLFSTASNEYTDFFALEPDVQFYILMNDEDLTKPVAHFLYTAYMKRKSILYK